jgi:RHS repeat-associated protein
MNAAQFTGRENDGTGLYYYRARYYSPNAQRSIGEDPLEFASDGVNLFTYALNAPTRYTDPSGLIVVPARPGTFPACERSSGRKHPSAWDRFLCNVEVGQELLIPVGIAGPNARTTTNAAEIFRRLERFHGIDPVTASERLHDIKRTAGHGPADNVIFDLTGNIYDQIGNWIGSLTQGGAKVVR